MRDRFFLHFEDTKQYVMCHLAPATCLAVLYNTHPFLLFENVFSIRHLQKKLCYVWPKHTVYQKKELVFTWNCLISYRFYFALHNVFFFYFKSRILILSKLKNIQCNWGWPYIGWIDHYSSPT